MSPPPDTGVPVANYGTGLAPPARLASLPVPLPGTAATGPVLRIGEQRSCSRTPFDRGW